MKMVPSYPCAALVMLVGQLAAAAAPSLAAAPMTTVELTPRPNPPETGDNTLSLKITDETGKTVDGASVTVDVFMPAMGTMARMEERATISAKTGGIYEATFALSMGGTWEITLTVARGGSGDKDVSHYSITTGILGVASKGTSRTAAAATGGRQGSVDGGGGGVTSLLGLGPERLQKIGVRFAEAKVMALRRDVEAVGLVEQDQTHRDEVTLRFSGYVVKQFRGRVGDSVQAGEPLFSVYSPDLVTAQSEFLLAEKISGGGSGDGSSLHQAAGEKLKNLGLSEKEVSQIRRDGKPMRDVVIRSRVAGTILDIAAREGTAVTAGQVLYVVGDLRKSFIVARVFQQDVGDLHVGQRAEINVPGGKNSQAVPATIDLIYPQVEQGAGTANVRVVISRYVPGLRPGAYVDVRIPVSLGNLLTVPVGAILYSGRHRYVFVDRGEGNLEPREVEVGKTAAGMAEIASGLAAGERVAASGTFLLGSEAQLRSALPKWKADQGTEIGGTQ